MRYLLLSTLLFTLTSVARSATLSDTTAPKKSDSSNVLTWLASHGFKIRKGFAPSTTDNTSPAKAFWYKDLSSKFQYTLVDFGIQNNIDLARNSAKNILTLFPSFEWHKDGDTSSSNKNNKNTLTAGVNLEWGHLVAPLCYPFITASINYKHDYLKKLETLNYSGYLSLWYDKPWMPGNMRTRYPGTYQLIFRYYPYTGIESYNSTKTSSLSTNYWASRITMEVAPLPKHFKVTIDYTYRVKLNDDLYKQGDVYWLSTSLNYYFDANNQIGFGLEYCKGYDPNNSFTKTEKIDLGFKLKV